MMNQQEKEEQITLVYSRVLCCLSLSVKKESECDCSPALSSFSCQLLLFFMKIMMAAFDLLHSSLHPNCMMIIH